ncbi:LacI family DNA-binding transcriptional regulator [Streptococcus plurextorum]|uniref:LacI family DNA-binding transcriptional regulator n=1 Tax=Streptococcus plurextorum TaxID=456876 RepID=UPI0003F716AD|nr:LacI family DNA-binding transcriptional regulator [Streptococcus plurextorum]
MATLKDVAKLACVDVSTVSRALNNSSYVHPETKARILEAVKELSYQPNILAKGLRQGKRNTIGVLVPHLHLTAFAEIIKGIEEMATKEGFATLICHTEDSELFEKEYLNRLRNGFVDGIIIAATGQNKKLICDIQASGLPVMQIMRKQIAEISSVTVDYRSSAREAVRYFVNKGCRHIGLINGELRLAPYRERYEGYKKEIRSRGLLETITEQEGAFNTMTYGYSCTLELLEKNPELDAIIAAVDMQGIGALRALKERGKRVPKDVRLISLTGQEIGAMLETSMTAMEIPAVEIGVKAAQMLIESLKSKSSYPRVAKHLVYNSMLVEREST